jgi:hypothetical protein
MIALSAEWSETGEVWATEVGVLAYMVASEDAQAAEARLYLEYLLDNPGVERFAWFIGRNPSLTEFAPTIWRTELIGSDGALTPLGEAFRATVAPGWWR